MTITETLYLHEPTAWREWLRRHHERKTEIWLLYPRAASGRPRLPYAAAVEEALCFGWIDGLEKGYDADCTAQRFTPRRARSTWSALNKERARQLVAAGRMTAAGLAALGRVLDEAFEVPADIRAALQAQPPAWENFTRFAPAYQRLRIGYIEEMRGRPVEFARRLSHFLRCTGRNETFGAMS